MKTTLATLVIVFAGFWTSPSQAKLKGAQQIVLQELSILAEQIEKLPNDFYYGKALDLIGDLKKELNTKVDTFICHKHKDGNGQYYAPYSIKSHSYVGPPASLQECIKVIKSKRGPLICGKSVSTEQFATFNIFTQKFTDAIFDDLDVCIANLQARAPDLECRKSTSGELYAPYSHKVKRLVGDYEEKDNCLAIINSYAH